MTEKVPGEREIISLAGRGEGRYVDRRSEFIGYACPVSTEEEAAEFVASVRSAHPDARHVVYAYSLRKGAAKRYSDDGEPQGSAGRPVLGVLEKEGVDGAVIAVVRYFGGILLGAGGLVRAYSSAASAALEDAGVVRLEPACVVSVGAGYDGYAKIQRAAAAAGAAVESVAYGERVEAVLTVRTPDLQKLREAVRDASQGSASFDITGEKFIPVKKN